MTSRPTASLPDRSRVRLTPGAALVVLAAVVVAVLGGPAALAGLSTTARAGSCAGADGVHAGLVVDFGDVDAGSPRPADTADCVADPGANGVTLLVARFGRDGVRIGSNGLICAIDGYPAEGCGERLPNQQYRYWSYWKGGSSWTYSPVGPAARLVSDGSVDGWHFVDGSASPSDGAPANAPSTGPCPSTAPTAPVTAPPSSGGGGPGQVSPTSAPAGSSVAPPSTGPSTGDTAAADPSVSADAPDSTAAGDLSGTTGTGADDLGGVEQASTVRSSGSGSVGSGPLVAIAVALAVVALGGGAVARFRSRADE